MSDLGKSLGYTVTTSDKVEHSGRTLKLRYRYGDQRDLVKVDLIHLNRSPLLEAEKATCMASSPEMSATTLALAELVAGKTKALFDRPAVRDLYDIYRIQSEGLPASMAGSDQDLYRLQRRVRIYYASLSMPFPCPLSGSVVEKFANRAADLERELYPVLHVGDRPTLGVMMEAASADIIVISLALSKASGGLIGTRELGWMKPDAIIVNVARGEIIDERAFFEHLKTHPDFRAGIDACWIEPFRHGRFEMTYPFLDLPNVIGTPHDSGMVPDALTNATKVVVANLKAYAAGEPIKGLLKRDDYIEGK